MEYGRITHAAKLGRIQWDLPSLSSPAEQTQLERLKRAAEKNPSAQEIYVGLPVWGESAWNGKLFPPGTKTENFLKEYAQQFSTVEINSTFYSVPGEETFKKWVEAVQPGFKFCPKFPQTITRSLKDGLNVNDLPMFLERVAFLESHLGVSFLQLPQDIGMESMGRIQTLFSKIPREAKAMVEFRNPSFFSDRRLKPEVVEILTHHHLGTVITDTAQFRSLTHASLSHTRVLVRFAANNGHATDFPRLKQWAERLRLWYQHGIKEVHFTVHATETLPQIEIARQFIQDLNAEFETARVAVRIAEPSFYHEIQGSLF